MENFNIWDGVYESFDEVKGLFGAWDSHRWIQAAYQKTKNLLDANDNFINPNIESSSNLLSVVVAMLEKENLSILDFGGSTGLAYVELLSCLSLEKNISFDVCDSEKSCEQGKRIFSDDKNINFITSLPDSKKYDIIHTAGALRYIENWQELLKKLASYDAEIFILKDLAAGDITKTYATSQKYYEYQIPCWFFKLGDILETMQGLGYKLIFKTNFYGHILNDKYHHLPQDNFKKELQVGYAKNLIFKKNK